MAVLGWHVQIYCMKHRVSCLLQIYTANCQCKLNMDIAVKELQQNNIIQQ